MTDKKDEALKLALEALENAEDQLAKPYSTGARYAITAIKEALAEQCVCGEPDTFGTHRTDGPCLAEQPAPATPLREQQEPVAYAVYHRMGGSKTLHWPEQHSEDGDHNEYQLVPLYTSPPIEATPLASQSRSDVKPWVGLTDEEYSQLHDGFHQQGKLLGWVVDQVEAKLKEKNA